MQKDASSTPSSGTGQTEKKEMHTHTLFAHICVWVQTVRNKAQGVGGGNRRGRRRKQKKTDTHTNTQSWHNGTKVSHTLTHKHNSGTQIDTLKAGTMEQKRERHTVTLTESWHEGTKEKDTHTHMLATVEQNTHTQSHTQTHTH